MKQILPIFSVLIVLLGLSSVLVEARDESRRDLREISAKISGGATLLASVSSSRQTQAFSDRTRRFTEVVRRRDRVGDGWREVRSSFEAARQSIRNERDPQVRFLVAHLQEDLDEADPLVSSYAGSPGGSPSTSGGRISFIDKETCVGTGRSGKPCFTSRDSLTFDIPRDITVINRLDGEWRDFGRGSDAEIYINDRLVWRTDVARDWDGDGKTLDVRIQPGSTLTIRCSTGDPIWIRKLTAETLATASVDPSHRNPWDFVWQGRN